MSEAIVIWAMVLGTILTIVIFVGSAIARDNRRQRDGSYGLSQTKNKAKADLISRQNQLALLALPVPKAPPEEFKNVTAEIERDRP